MKLFLKIVMLLALIVFVCLSLLHLLKLNNPTAGAYWLAIFTIAMLIVYFLVFFLDLEIISKWVSVKARMNHLEKRQQELIKLATALYKISLINIASRGKVGKQDKFFEKHVLVTKEIEKYLSAEDINSFMKELLEIQTNSS